MSAPRDPWDDEQTDGLLAWGPTGAADAPAGLTIPQVSARISSALGQTFPEPFWVVGECAEIDRTIRRGGKHWYFQLVDAEAEDPARRAALPARLWQRTIGKLFGPRGTLRGKLQPADGMVLRALVRADFYAPKGEVSLIVEDIDPAFTLGNLDRQRRETLERLTREGALDWNKARPLVDLPLRIGLVTALGSAAHEDFLKELLAAGIGFSVLACDARMQGPDTITTVPAALATLSASAPDVIVLTRGGGSRLDLSWFDREEVARAVATCPVPVLTAIGHEIDTSVADLAAHTAFKTPTAAAAFLAERGTTARRLVADAGARIVEHLTRTLAEQHEAVLAACRDVRRSTEARLALERSELAGAGRRVGDGAERRLASAARRLTDARARLVAGPHIEALGRHEHGLAMQAVRLEARAEATLERCRTRLENDRARLRLLDPKRLLDRGYSLLRRADGSVLTDAADVRRGDLLTAVMRDGEVDAKVSGVRITENPAAAERLDESPIDPGPDLPPAVDAPGAP